MTPWISHAKSIDNTPLIIPAKFLHEIHAKALKKQKYNKFSEAC